MNTPGNNVLIIAEIGVNHNGSLELARELIDAAAKAGVDIVKFQGFSAGKLASESAPKANYQTRSTGQQESQLEMLRKLELSEEDFLSLAEYSAKKKLEFMLTPLDVDYVNFIDTKLNSKQIKLGSGALTNGPLLLASARTLRPVILSTGLSTLQDIENALQLMVFGYLTPEEKIPTASLLEGITNDTYAQTLLKDNVSLLHCTSEYPAPRGEVNLNAMRTLSDTFGLTVGYSDHTEGIDVSIMAACAGAKIIEKHMTLDCSLEGPDHSASIEPAEMQSLVRGVRDVERVLGSANKEPTASEIQNANIVRQSLTVSRAIKKGDKFSSDNLTVKRPGHGISPMKYWDWIGRIAERDYAPDEVIEK